MTDLYLATINSVTNNEGYTLLLDGETNPTSKKYKMLVTGSKPQLNDRVLVLKMSGTYVVLGKIGTPN